MYRVHTVRYIGGTGTVYFTKNVFFLKQYLCLKMEQPSMTQLLAPKYHKCFSSPLCSYSLLLVLFLFLHLRVCQILIL
jgi:hypothetical protein